MTTAAPQWTRREERGSPILIRFMVWFSLVAGRRVSRVLLRAIAAYFLATGGAARRATRDFLARALGRAPTLSEQYRTFFDFAATIHDRIYFLKSRFDLFEIEVHGKDLFEETGLFSKGLTVYQASVVGPRPDPQASDVFFDGLRLPS